MRAANGRADEPPAATQKAGPGDGSPFATAWLVTWHSDLVAWVDRLGWLRSLSDWLTGVLRPVRVRYQDSLGVELLHGGRWVGHPLHPALSDLPVGLWTGATVLDEPCVVDGNLITARFPYDLPRMVKALVAQLVGAER